MRIVRFLIDHMPVLGVLEENGNILGVREFSSLFDNCSDIMSIARIAKKENKTTMQLIEERLKNSSAVVYKYSEIKLLTPVEAAEVWAAGVTYERSREARNVEMNKKEEEISFYDKVYDAERPELFFKSTASRTYRPNQALNIRDDSSWQIPEPELGLVLSSEGEIVGYTIGNDMSSRDIEGENPLYLPQAKVWDGSCSFGPAIRLAESVEDPYSFEITCRIYRDGKKAFEGAASTKQLKRTYDELIQYLQHNNIIFDGTVLFTGTAIVPPDEFSLQADDRVEIEISGIGTLVNSINQL